MATNIAGIGREGILDGAGHAPQRRLVKDVVDALADFATGIGVADVAINKCEIQPLVGPDPGPYLLQVALMAGGKIIQANYVLPEI